MEKIKGEAVDRALDRAVFGTNDPDVIKDKVNKMADYLRFEASSLGRSLAGIRYRNYWSVERVAAEVGVDVTVWEPGSPTRRSLEPTSFKGFLRGFSGAGTWSGS